MTDSPIGEADPVLAGVVLARVGDLLAIAVIVQLRGGEADVARRDEGGRRHGGGHGHGEGEDRHDGLVGSRLVTAFVHKLPKQTCSDSLSLIVTPFYQ